MQAFGSSAVNKELRNCDFRKVWQRHEKFLRYWSGRETEPITCSEEHEQSGIKVSWTWDEVRGI
jgi:hypothetical protein